MAYPPYLLGVVGGRCMTVKHTDTHQHTHIHTQTHTHTAGSPSQSVDVLSSPGFSGLLPLTKVQPLSLPTSYLTLGGR